MKRLKCITLIILTVLLGMVMSGCYLLGSVSGSGSEISLVNTVNYMNNWSFQYNEATDDYSLFFALCTKSRQEIASDATVDIRIENENGAAVFEGTKTIRKSDFSSYTSKITGDHFLANVRIKASELTPGSSSNGTIYFTVYKNGVFSFDEVNCAILYQLPVEDIIIKSEALPQEVEIKGYNGSVETKIVISGVTTNCDDIKLSKINVVISGEKTYGKNSGSYDKLTYKLYDSEGYMVKSGTIFLRSIGVGDKFKDDSILIYDLTPGETYTIKFSSYEW